MTVKRLGRRLLINKKLTGILAGFLLMSATANAQIVTVDGYGPDRASALRDAERIAVENVVGTYIDSQTMVSQGQVALDDIYAKATGFCAIPMLFQRELLQMDILSRPVLMLIQMVILP